MFYVDVVFNNELKLSLFWSKLCRSEIKSESDHEDSFWRRDNKKNIELNAWCLPFTRQGEPYLGTFYSATTWTGPLRTKLTNQSVNWEQRMASFFGKGPIKLKNANNGLTTKIGNPTKLRKVADVSGNFVTFWLVRFDPIFWNFFRLFNGFKRFR